MITKLGKKFTDLKIGLMGSRCSYLEEVLHSKKIPYFSVKNAGHIDNTFDIVFGSGLYEAIHEPKLSLPKYGLILFHETPLPEGRGFAPLQWTVENHRPNLTITAFKATEKIDAGDYIYQHNVSLSPLDSCETLEEKRKIGIQECLSVILEELKQGFLVFRKQTGTPSMNKKRVPENSKLNPQQSLLELWDTIRICDNQKFPAFFILDGKKIILRYEILNDEKA